MSVDALSDEELAQLAWIKTATRHELYRFALGTVADLVTEVEESRRQLVDLRERAAAAESAEADARASEERLLQIISEHQAECPDIGALLTSTAEGYEGGGWGE